ncbi:MAG: hypothetical protein K2X27_17860 [Candidatus Obscuribacterales bacterium]|nr:hypothetical protein [Candidatus Obscuribacterales bacterium]
MYWRVRKISPDQVAKTYGVHAVCIVSVLFNLILFSKVAPSNKLTETQRINFDTFARQVTRHLVDGCFLTYESSMSQLAFASTKSELGPDVIKLLAQAGIVPPNPEEMKAIGRQLKETKSVSQVSINKVNIEEPSQASKGLVPIEVSGLLVKHSAEGVMGPDPFRFKLLVGQRGGDTPLPVVAAFQDLSGQPEQASPQGGP